MRLVRREGDTLTILVSIDEVRILLGGLRETLDAVEDWEVPIRMGAEIGEIRSSWTACVLSRRVRQAGGLSGLQAR